MSYFHFSIYKAFREVLLLSYKCFILEGSDFFYIVERFSFRKLQIFLLSVHLCIGIQKYIPVV